MEHRKMKIFTFDNSRGIGRDGFTLIEILVVLAIITVMLGVGIPFLRGSSQRMRLKSALRGAIGLFNYARMEAISRRKWTKIGLDSSSCLTVSLREDQGQWSSLDKRYCLPKGIDAVWQGGNEVVFFPSGEAQSRVCLKVSNDMGKARDICVSALSGKVSIE